MSQTYSSIWIHLIWSTKDREETITKKLKYLLYDKIRQIADENEFHLDFVNGTEDHIHCLISLNPKFTISDVVKKLKGGSSFWINDKSMTVDHFAWQNGYAVFSVSPSQIQRVRNYIKNQEKHHKNIAFKQEIDKLKEMI